jgi:DNA primase
VVEGYMDVVALAQHGVENAVATLGTATTPIHLAKLLRMADNVVFSFDGDNAGRKAAWRALEVSLPVLSDGKVVSFLFLPREDDPDTYVRREGREGFAKAVAAAKPLSQFLFAELAATADLANEEGRARLVAQAKPLIAQIEAPALGAMLRRRLAELAHLSPAQVDALIPSKLAQASATPPDRPRRRSTSNGVRLLALLLNNPSRVNQIPEVDLSGEMGADLATLRAVCAFFREDPRRNAAMASAYFEGSEHAAVISEAMQEPLLKQAESPDFDEAAEVEGLVDKFRQARLARRKDQLLGRLVAGTATPDEKAEYGDLQSRMATARAGPGAPEAGSKF